MVLLLANLLFLFLSTSCIDDKPEQEGDPDPKVAFFASINPRAVTLTPSAPSATITLGGQCAEGQDCPVNPSWDFSRAALNWGEIVVNGNQATITVLNWDALQKEATQSSLGSLQRDVSFTPIGLPAGAVLGGYYTVHVTLVPDGSLTPPQQAQPADQPRLSVQRALDFTLAVNDPPLALTVPISYTGPANTLSIDGPQDLGVKGSASKFIVLSPPSGFSLPGDGSPPPPLKVQFRVDPADVGTHYKAAITISVDNARPVPVILTGVRNSF